MHSTNSRSQTLNLDIADLFKPIIVDRVIFTMINKNMFDVEKDFHVIEGGGVYLTKRGKRLFVNELDNKVHSKLTVNNVQNSYDALMTDEIGKLYQAICYGKKYKPYKYY